MTKDKPIERCSECDEPTGKAGIGEDSLTVDGVNPLCEKCFDASMTGAEQSGEVAGFLADLREVVDGSRGVDGWHLNDDIATWGELNITVDRIDKLLTHLSTSGNDMSDRQMVTKKWVDMKDEEEDQPLMDKETAGDMKYHALKDEGLLDRFGRRKDANRT